MKRSFTDTSFPVSKRIQQPQNISKNNDSNRNNSNINNDNNNNKNNINNKTSSDPMFRLHEACKNVDMATSAYQNWANPSYFASFSLGLMLCPLKLVKTDFWKSFHKVFRKEGRKKGIAGKEKTVHFGDEETTRLKLLVMSINPYTWLLQGYVEKSLLGGDICKESSLQRYVDKVISGVKLRQNQGLIFTPLVPLCRPCDVGVHSIIRFENFESDVKSVLHSLQLDSEKSQLLKDSLREDVTELTLSAISHFTLHECANITYIPLRLLEAFKIKGYVIPDKLKDYLFNLKRLSTREVRGAVSTLAYGTVLTSTESRSVIQQDYYKGLSFESIQYIQEIFKFEFEAFGYDKIP